MRSLETTSKNFFPQSDLHPDERVIVIGKKQLPSRDDDNTVRWKDERVGMTNPPTVSQLLQGCVGEVDVPLFPTPLSGIKIIQLAPRNERQFKRNIQFEGSSKKLKATEWTQLFSPTRKDQ